jgi:hypothetical protein
MRTDWVDPPDGVFFFFSIDGERAYFLFHFLDGAVHHGIEAFSRIVCLERTFVLWAGQRLSCAFRTDEE